MANGEAFDKEALALTGDELSRSQPQGVRGVMPETDDVRLDRSLSAGGCWSIWMGWLGEDGESQSLNTLHTTVIVIIKISRFERMPSKTK